MGYRSDVYIKTTRDGYKKLREEIKKENENGLKLLDNYGTLFVNDKEGTITTELQYMKWYEEFEDVRAVMNAIDELSDTYPIHFIRIGESVDDVEERYYYPDNFSGDFDCLEFYRYVKPIGKETKIEDFLNEKAV